MNRLSFLAILLVIIFLGLSSSLLLDEPAVWPDEALYGDIAGNLMLENRLGTDLLKGMIAGVESHAYWIPPLYMYALSLWFKFFGFSIETQRYFSVFLSSLLIILLYFISKSSISVKNKGFKKYLPLLPVLLLIVDATFLKTSRLGRPEILVLVLTLAALLFYIKTFKPAPRQTLLMTLIGFFLGLAFVSHLLAIAFIIPIYLHSLILLWKKTLSFKQLLCSLAAFVLPFAIWSVSIFPHYDLLLNQLSLISDSRNFTIPWYVNVSNFSFLIKLNYILYAAISLFFVLLSFKNPKSQYIFLSLLLISAWIFITLGEIFWYTVYPLPFVYLALCILIAETVNITKKQLPYKILKALPAVIVILFIFTGLNDYSRVFSLYNTPDSYSTFTNQVTENIPEGKTVFLSSIPDAYFAFDPGRNTLYQYPAFFADTDAFKKVLDQTDYIIFNGYYSPEQISHFLDKYMADNLESVKELKTPYQALIVKLKDKSLRH